jgi:hypothetical protein
VGKLALNHWLHSKRCHSWHFCCEWRHLIFSDDSSVMWCRCATFPFGVSLKMLKVQVVWAHHIMALPFWMTPIRMMNIQHTKLETHGG